MTGALAADLCELNMAASYLWRGMVGPATFSLLSAAFRPAGRPDGHGLEDCLTFLERFHFDEDERARLGDTLGFNEPALDAFRRLRFTGEVWAVPEGRIVFAGEPLLGDRADRRGAAGRDRPTEPARPRRTASGPQAGCFGPRRPPRSHRPA